MLLVAVTAPPSLCALGLRNPNLDAEATARGNAFTATANNPSAIYYNPAGIVQMEGNTVQAGAYVTAINSDYRSFTGVKAETEFEILTVPELYYTLKPKESCFAYGLGLFAPYGLGLEWPEDNPFRTLAIEGRLTYMTLNPVVAWQAHPNFSVALGPTVNYSETKLRQGLGATATDELIFQGSDFDYGFNAGLLWQPHPQWSLGASYRSATTINYRGTTRTRSIPALTGSARTTGALDFPQFVMAGVSYRPTTNWNVEADIDWTDWDTLDSVTFNGTSKMFGRNLSLPFSWESSFLYELGVTRYLSGGLFVSTGYFFSQNSTSDRYFNPMVPDTDLHVASLGFGYKGKRWHWAVSGQIITGPSRTVDNSLLGASANGKYHWFNQAVNLSLAYHF